MLVIILQSCNPKYHTGLLKEQTPMKKKSVVTKNLEMKYQSRNPDVTAKRRDLERIPRSLHQPVTDSDPLMNRK